MTCIKFGIILGDLCVHVNIVSVSKWHELALGIHICGLDWLFSEVPLLQP